MKQKRWRRREKGLTGTATPQRDPHTPVTSPPALGDPMASSDVSGRTSWRSIGLRVAAWWERNSG